MHERAVWDVVGPFGIANAANLRPQHSTVIQWYRILTYSH